MSLDYSNQNLTGQSFKGQNLERVNFSGADIRSVDFTGANLKGANFRHAQAGLQRRWAIFLVVVSCVLMGLSEFLSAFGGALVVELVFSKEGNDQIAYQIAGWTIIVILVILFFVTILQGSGGGLGVFAGVFAVAITVAGAFAVAAAGAGAGVGAGVGVGVLAASGIVAGVVAGAIAIAIAGAVAGANAGAIAIVFAGAFAIAGAVAGANAGAIARTLAVDAAGAGAFLGVLYVVFLSTIISLRALNEDPNHALIRKIAIAIAAFKGTSFRSADLTDADFTGATLKSTVFRKATLTRTRFYEAQKLDLARVDNSILANKAVLELLVNCNGRKKSYIGANLKGANLIGVDLKEANLKGADITEATFQGACLEWANLTLTQAVGTDFTSAQMTGACVEAWNIESTTKLHNVDCDFVYLLENPKPGTDDRERRPSSGKFKPGEFTKLFQEVLNTVDLIFRNGVDWKAFVTVFEKVQVENEGTELAIQSIENKGDGVVIVRVSVPPNANKEKIHGDFTQNYQLALKAVEKRYKSELKAKETEIQFHRQKNSEMLEIIRYQSKQKINITNNNGAKSISKSKSMDDKTENTYNLNHAKLGGGFAGTGGTQTGGTLYDYSSNQNLSEAAKEIQKILQQLSATNPTTNTTEKMAVAAKAVEAIENDPNLKAQVIAALNSSSTEAFKEAINHPLAKNMMPIIEEWTEA